MLRGIQSAEIHAARDHCVDVPTSISRQSGMVCYQSDPFPTKFGELIRNKHVDAVFHMTPCAVLVSAPD